VSFEQNSKQTKQLMNN